MHRKIARVVIAACVFVPVAGFSQTQDALATQPAAQLQTGELDLTFTQRSPLSTPQEIARRLNVTPTSLGDNYDLSKLPFKAYVPSNYDLTKQYGLLVLLNYKDTDSTPPLWHPVLDKSHVIFISPVCHTGEQHPPSVPLWQTIGLAFDAVYNCKKQFNIDSRRIYLMSFVDNSSRTSYSTSDVFTGFIVAADAEYWRRIYVPGNQYYEAAFTPPPAELMSLAKTRPFFLIGDTTNSNVDGVKLILGAMQHDGFSTVTIISLSIPNDLHYPNMKSDWFEQQALPFLDKGGNSENAIAASISPSSQPSATPQTAPTVSEPQHLLTLARLYMSNGMADQARKKLQEIIDTYPDDPAAQTAKDLLSQMKQ
jgi:hypothetical protein